MSWGRHFWGLTKLKNLIYSSPNNFEYLPSEKEIKYNHLLKMTTKLTYWDRSPQESTQSAGDCTSRQIPQRDSLWYPSTQRYLQQSLTWHGVSSQVSHTLKRLTPTAPPKLICIAKPKAQTKILAQQRVIHPNLNQKKKKNELYVGHREFTSAQCPETRHREFMYSRCPILETP